MSSSCLSSGPFAWSCSPPASGAPAGQAQGGEQLVGFKHLAFDVPKLELVIAALRADGIEVDPIIDMGHVVPGFRIVFFRDPEGNILELMEGYQDEGQGAR